MRRCGLGEDNAYFLLSQAVCLLLRSSLTKDVHIEPEKRGLCGWTYAKGYACTISRELFSQYGYYAHAKLGICGWALAVFQFVFLQCCDAVFEFLVCCRTRRLKAANSAKSKTFSSGCWKLTGTNGLFSTKHSIC